jgi:hypothetical protein
VTGELKPSLTDTLTFQFFVLVRLAEVVPVFDVNRIRETPETVQIVDGLLANLRDKRVGGSGNESSGPPSNQISRK